MPPLPATIRFAIGEHQLSVTHDVDPPFGQSERQRYDWRETREREPTCLMRRIHLITDETERRDRDRTP